MKMNSLKLVSVVGLAAIASTALAELPASPMPATTFESGDTQTTLIELFTSEGCSSCPPADAWLSKLKNDPDLWKRVVPVAFHVDYWNRLGWTDRFSRPEFTDRQRRYAAAWRIDSIYTPNFVVNGQEWKGWFNNGMLSARSEKAGRLRVTLTNNIKISATFESAESGPFKLEVAVLGTNLQSDVKRGENSGRKLRHDFVALKLVKIDMKNAGGWTGTLSLPQPSTGDKPSAIAAWITSGEDTAPIQATGGWLQ